MGVAEDAEEQNKIFAVQTRTCVKLWWFMTFSWIFGAIYTVLDDDVILVKVSGFVLETSNISDVWTKFEPLSYTCGIVIALTFLIGQVTGNVSQVDKLWSLLPPLYTYICFLSMAPAWSSRLVIMSSLTFLWGFRLTYNFYRRGGYSWPPWKGEEDYRWNIVRAWPLLNTNIGWFLFNLIFICFYQNILLLLLAVPTVACLHSERPLNFIDFGASVTFLVLLTVESYADQQQFDFQSLKYSQKKPNFPHSLGFVTSGLFAICRHPNYMAEQVIWIVFYLFSIAATGVILNETAIGCVLLCLLFQGSTALSEGITSRKYSKYREYKQKCPMFVGNFWSLSGKYNSILDE